MTVCGGSSLAAVDCEFHSMVDIWARGSAALHRCTVSGSAKCGIQVGGTLELTESHIESSALSGLKVLQRGRAQVTGGVIARSGRNP